MMTRVLLFVSALFLMGSVFAQKSKTPVKDTISGEAFLRVVEQSLNLFYEDYANKSNYDSVIKALNYEPNQIPQFSDQVYCERLSRMNEMSPFHLDCNSITLSQIRFFAEKRRSFARVVLGRSKLYFDMFEEKLAEHNMPIELKYLAVIESGLRPQVKSRAGALGLWQFMYRTGLYYDLHENSYIDERMDPEKATEAACRYLKKLHDIYGDWNLALAAYNAGPGNVNKAIRRSGGKTTYWGVRPYLPRETQGYVPNFIAAAYLLTYHAEHNIIPMEAKLHYAQLDTICLKEGVHMRNISKLIDWDLEEIKILNPIYKTDYIPFTKPNQCIYGPHDKIGNLVGVESDLYLLENGGRMTAEGDVVSNNPESADEDEGDSEEGSEADTPKIGFTYHKVISGDNLGKIAEQYDVSINDIMSLNGMRNTRIDVGQVLKIKAGETEVKQTTKTPTKPTVDTKKYYTVRSGDTFSKIASRYGMTQQQLSRLNPGVSTSRIHVGQKLRVN